MILNVSVSLFVYLLSPFIYDLLGIGQEIGYSAFGTINSHLFNYIVSYYYYHNGVTHYLSYLIIIIYDINCSYHMFSGWIFRESQFPNFHAVAELRLRYNFNLKSHEVNYLN